MENLWPQFNPEPPTIREELEILAAYLYAVTRGNCYASLKERRLSYNGRTQVSFTIHSFATILIFSVSFSRDDTEITFTSHVLEPLNNRPIKDKSELMQEIKAAFTSPCVKEIIKIGSKERQKANNPFPQLPHCLNHAGNKNAASPDFSLPKETEEALKEEFKIWNYRHFDSCRMAIAEPQKDCIGIHRFRIFVWSSKEEIPSTELVTVFFNEEGSMTEFQRQKMQLRFEDELVPCCCRDELSTLFKETLEYSAKNGRISGVTLEESQIFTFKEKVKKGD